MTVLALDTSSRQEAWVLRTDAAGAIHDERRVRGGALDRGLGGALAELLDPSIAAVVVLTGPGSYTGVRGGIAAALGVATARGLPLHGLGTLAAVALGSAAFGVVEVVADAGRGGVYIARYERSAGALVEVTPLRRGDASDLSNPGRRFATTVIEDVEVILVDPRAALAAAVPQALARPPLPGAGLSSTTG